jgi:hypothetical protein
MAVAKIVAQRIQRFMGVSTDPKPTDSSIVTGSLFLCTDTTKVFIYDGVSTWTDVTAIMQFYL